MSCGGWAFPVQVCSCTRHRTRLFLQSNAASKPKENHLLVPPSPFHSFPFSGCNSYLSKLTHSLPAHGAACSGIQNAVPGGGVGGGGAAGYGAGCGPGLQEPAMPQGRGGGSRLGFIRKTTPPGTVSPGFPLPKGAAASLGQISGKVLLNRPPWVEDLALHTWKSFDTPQ